MHLMAGDATVVLMRAGAWRSGKLIYPQQVTGGVIANVHGSGCKDRE